MSGPLFPVADVPEFMAENSSYDMDYKYSAKWDLEAGDFVRDGANRVVGCDGMEAFATWCHKTVQTERYCCLDYPDSIGTEMERAMDHDDEKLVESMVERTVRDALMVNPRTEDVYGFDFAWDGDVMHCSFLVKGVGWGQEIAMVI